jgi:hypothetical protein
MVHASRHIHLALPWFLEGAIRGSYKSTIQLMAEFYLDKAEPNRKADALQDYWGGNHQQIL